MMQKRALWGTIFIIIAFILIVLSLFMPWYGVRRSSYSGEDSYESVTDYYFDYAHVKAHFSGPQTEYISNPDFEDDMDYDDADIEDEPPIEVIRTTKTFVIVGIIGCILGLIGAAMVSLGKLSSKAGAFLVLLAMILVIIAPLYIMAALPSSFEEMADKNETELSFKEVGTDFFGSQSTTEESFGSTIDVEYSWGGGIGWFLPIIAMVFCIIALIAVAKSEPAKEPIPQFGIEPPGAPAMFQPETQMAPGAQIPMTFQPELQMLSQPPLGQPGSSMAFQPESLPPTQGSLLVPPAGAKGDQFQCPDCGRIFIVAPGRRPAILTCPYCGLRGLIE